MAAEVLARGGTVWTTNIDSAVEMACLGRGTEVKVAGRAADRAPRRLQPLRDAGPGCLVKFHGTSEALETLAFTDRELIAPLADEDARHLFGLGRGKTVVLYGYAGADPDLYGLLDEVFARASRVIWFEPSQQRREEIKRAFPNSHFEFRPATMPRKDATAREATGRAFLELAEEAGVAVESPLAAELLDQTKGPPALRPFALAKPPGVTQARIVERFGFPGDDRVALQTARRLDFRNRRLDSLPAHLRWMRNNSIYDGGALAAALKWLANRPWLLGRLRPLKLRDYVITRACGVLLQKGDWRELELFAGWAVRTRSDNGDANPSDLYYRAHAHRYTLQISAAARDAQEAQAGLSSSSDPERHAGAVLEVGSMAIYRGRFEEALRAGFELRYRTGRFAIRRWQAWGAWLEAVALCHLGEPGRAREALTAARERFEGERRDGPLQDVRTVELLADRVALAQGDLDHPPDLGDEDMRGLQGRYRNDRCLVTADLAIGLGRYRLARERLEEVVRQPAVPMAPVWAQLGLSELDRLEGEEERAAESFGDLADRAGKGGMRWLQAQAAIGLSLCRDRRAAAVWEETRRELPDSAAVDSPEELACGEPRVLWMLLT
ncbi:MAG TPA: SIR2 family protein [Solirubrobacterales bacterium]|nr:SIR2 family protein [Solirubrobacterales bacterium]